MKPTQLDAERFWRKVRKTDSCWLWTTGAFQRTGYGQFWCQGRSRQAHRVAWILAHGEIPEGLHVLHSCPGGDNKLCCNPAHLRLGTPAENTGDAVVRGQLVRGERHWTHVHPENLHAGERHWSRRMPERVARGAKVNTAKLTPQDVEDIRAAYRPGYGAQARLGRKYGVARGTIGKIVKNQSWKRGDAS